MKKQLSIFLAVIFFAVQMGSFVHMAEHGFAHHEHNGQSCQVEAYFNASHSFDSSVSEVAVVHDLSVEEISFISVDESQRVLELSSSNLARAPPTHS
ncbi:MAG: hypothetical protein COV36_01215 [Alphaproteobacteria bacterium CG11_big_fil_rev_8_21_14_0_20_44_7]|nr:MAG: hypothetical protein COV36_01215 [Alphaproteobacteria bacterium CG11_big_fil_rev_8_21_14_0_20_44_7]